MNFYIFLDLKIDLYIKTDFWIKKAWKNLKTTSKNRETKSNMSTVGSKVPPSVHFWEHSWTRPAQHFKHTKHNIFAWVCGPRGVHSPHL